MEGCQHQNVHQSILLSNTDGAVATEPLLCGRGGSEAPHRKVAPLNPSHGRHAQLFVVSHTLPTFQLTVHNQVTLVFFRFKNRGVPIHPVTLMCRMRDVPWVRIDGLGSSKGRFVLNRYARHGRKQYRFAKATLLTHSLVHSLFMPAGPSQVAGTIVACILIHVVNCVLVGRRWAQKCKCNKAMDQIQLVIYSNAKGSGALHRTFPWRPKWILSASAPCAYPPFGRNKQL